MEKKNSIVIFEAADGETSVSVQLKDDTVWLTQTQMAELFQKDRTVITRHISNIFKEGELEKEVVCAKNAHTTQHGAMKGKKQEKEVALYNLDVIISVGYRVKSQRGTQFRIWANKILKEYLIKGYAINRQLELAHYTELKQLVQVLGRAVQSKENLTGDEASALIAVVSDYTFALDTLDRYDYQNIEIEASSNEQKFKATYEGAMLALTHLKEKFGASAMFGNEKDDSFRSSIGQIYQIFDGNDLYPSVEEKAAMLLYLVTKNHSFSDGNKRIAATLFLWFMSNNGILYHADGSKRIANSTLVALTLMIAESRTEV